MACSGHTLYMAMQNKCLRIATPLLLASEVKVRLSHPTKLYRICMLCHYKLTAATINSTYQETLIHYCGSPSIGRHSWRIRAYYHKPLIKTTTTYRDGLDADTRPGIANMVFLQSVSAGGICCTYTSCLGRTRQNTTLREC